MSFSSIRLTASQIFDHFGLYRLHCSVNLSGVYIQYLYLVLTLTSRLESVYVSDARDFVYLHNLQGLPNFGV